MDADRVSCSSLDVGEALSPPISSAEFWPSIDPQAIFSQQNWGISNFIGMHNQLGLYNGTGLWNQLGIGNLLGFGADTGGHVDAQPNYSSAAVSIDYASPSGDLWGPWRKNGNSICVAPCSDQTAKKDIRPILGSLDKVLSLQGVSFDWNEAVVPGRANEEGRQIGLIAQEVEKVVPEVVVQETIENQQLKSIRYENLVALLIEGMKDQQEQINSLKETVQELSTEVQNLRKIC
jgi:hypothetical protein